MSRTPTDVVAGVRVLFVLYYYDPYCSGLTLHVQRLAEDLARRGAQVTVLTTRHDPNLEPRASIRGVQVVRARPWLSVGKGPIAPGLLGSAIRLGSRADVIIPVMPLAEAGPISVLVPRSRLLPLYICDLRLGSDLFSRVVERLSALSARTTIARADRFCASSRPYVAASRVVSRYTSRCVAVPPPIEPGRFDASPAGAARLRARLGLADEPVVGFVGRIVYEKGLPVLVEAIRRLRADHPDVVLVIAGDGDAVAGGGVLDVLRAEISDDRRILLTGFLSDEDLVSFYSACTVLALPSIDPLEAYGMVQVEAMLCGCPVVASALPGVSIPIRTSGMGVLVPPGNPDALARGLAQVLAAPDRVRIPRSEVAAAFDPQIPYGAMADAVAITATQGR